MSTVVYATYQNLDELNNLQALEWLPGDNDSYGNTMQKIYHFEGVRLVGRRDLSGHVSPMFCYSWKRWENINNFHVIIARYLAEKFKSGDEQDFGHIDDPVVCNAVRQLIGVECGINVKYSRFGELHKAVVRLIWKLAELGLPIGDRMFKPLVRAVDSEA